MTHLANAQPRKKFFLDMFTRDLSFEDCVLDLIDNSIDALAKRHNLDLSPPLLADLGAHRPASERTLPSIEITYTDSEFEIIDNCGGISRQDALAEVFSFGHSRSFQTGQLGVYGVGLKRALFKIGRYFRIESRTESDGFKTAVDLEEWSQADERPEDWTIPLHYIPAAKTAESAGTKIVITRLTDEVKLRAKDKTLETALHGAIGTTYALFLNRSVRIRVNRKSVSPMEIPVGESTEVTPAHKNLVINHGGGQVKVKLIASLAARVRGEWSSERAGWYLLCNNRVILAADKSEFTGWNAGMPKFHSKYNGFVGLVFFQSATAGLLPWTTTKRGVNRDSVIFQKVRAEMLLVSRGIISFLNEMYPSELYEQSQQREIADNVLAAKLQSFAKKPTSDFSYSRRASGSPKSTVRVQFDARKSDVERIKKHLREPSWGASRVGEYAFKHFLENECAQ